MITVNDLLVGKRVVITTDDFNGQHGTIVEVNDEARPFQIDIDNEGIVDFNTSEFIIQKE